MILDAELGGIDAALLQAGDVAIEVDEVHLLFLLHFLDEVGRVFAQLGKGASGECLIMVCPEEIKITDNAIIPLKERIVDEFYDPLGKLFKIFR